MYQNNQIECESKHKQQYDEKSFRDLGIKFEYTHHKTQNIVTLKHLVVHWEDFIFYVCIF